MIPMGEKKKMPRCWKLLAISQYGREVIEEDLTREEARTYANEYRMAYGPGFTIKMVRQ